MTLEEERELRQNIMDVVTQFRINSEDRIDYVNGYSELGNHLSDLSTKIFNANVVKDDGSKREPLDFYSNRVTEILDATTIFIKSLTESIADDWNSGEPYNESIDGDYVVRSLFVQVENSGRLLTTMINQIIFEVFKGIKQLGYKVVFKLPTDDKGFRFFFEGNKSDFEVPFTTLDPLVFIDEVITPLLNFLMEDKDPEVENDVEVDSEY